MTLIWPLCALFHWPWKKTVRLYPEPAHEWRCPTCEAVRWRRRFRA